MCNVRASIAAVAVGALIGGFAIADIPKRNNEKENTEEKPIWAGITASHAVIATDHANFNAGLTILFALVNDSDKLIDPELVDSKIIVNGKELRPLIRRTGTFSGMINLRDLKLRPKESVEFGMGLGNEFKDPGIYRIAWKGKQFESAEVVFRVLPPKK
ncbi:MAG TPA: hypothetical protein VL371_04580 [Gemmataceae bacterium]|jgi:hypothetical protein|nr:hypothetical protein [Gemmataceae bacterium]